MAADKPLQDIYNTVRIPLMDSGVATQESNSYGFTDYESSQAYYNCYPVQFSDRAQAQYASQFDTYVEKRGNFSCSKPSIPGNAVIPIGNQTICHDNICMTNLDDVYCAAVWDHTSSLFRIIQYRPTANTALQIGTIAGTFDSNIYLTEGVVANTATLFVSFTNATETVSTGAYATSVGGVMVAASLTVIADVDYPANLANTVTRGQFLQMDGYAFIGTKQGGLYNSDLNSITSWNALSVISAIQYPDQGMNIVRYKNFILFFGEDSTEFFTNVNYNQGGAGSPLQRTDQAFIKFGCAWPRCVRSINDTVFWWAKSSTGKFGLYKLDGFTPVKVSTLKEDQYVLNAGYWPIIYPLIDKGRQHLFFPGIQDMPKLIAAAGQIATNSLPGQPNTDAYTGDPYSLVYSPDATIGTLALDIESGVFWFFNSSMNGASWLPIIALNFSGLSYTGFANPAFALSANGSPANSPGVVGGVAGVYVVGEMITGLNSEYKDRNVALADFPITVGIQFNSWDFGNEKRKTIHKFKLIQKQPGATRVASAYGSNITPYTWVIYNKQEGNLDSTPSGMTKIWKRPIIQNSTIFRTYLNNLGTARKWNFAIIQKSMQPFAAKAIELDISQRG
jgi:hypothetical protein